MSVDTVATVLGAVAGTLFIQLGARFVLLRFIRRKLASLLAGILMLVASPYAGDMMLVTALTAAVTLLAQMAREPAVSTP